MPGSDKSYYGKPSSYAIKLIYLFNPYRDQESISLIEKNSAQQLYALRCLLF